MANQNDQQRTILPIPDPPRTGLITYDGIGGITEIATGAPGYRELREVTGNSDSPRHLTLDPLSLSVNECETRESNNQKEKPL